jgi:Glucoamylase and related glycosyl hydrolases
LAQQLKAENDQIKGRLENLDKGYLNEYGTRLENQLNVAKQAYRDAHDRGDVDKMFEAQQMLNRVSIEQERYRLAKQRQDQNAQRVQVQQQPEQQATYQQQPQQQAPKPDPRAESWAEKNDWFGQDEVMTYAAFGIHRKLVEEEGFDPSSDDYYNEIDRRMRKEFPNRFGAAKTGSVQVASADTSASRSRNSGRTKVKLSPSQVAMGKEAWCSS